MDKRLLQMLSSLQTQAPTIRAAYDDLFDSGLGTIPIPFFGDIRHATVITVGLNPSDGEFRGRGWSYPVDNQALYDRLTRYFVNSPVPPHPWFNTWEQALRHIGVSYSNGSAAHVDVCPWPTRPMSQLPDKQRFTELVAKSLPGFWNYMRETSHCRLVLMGGTVNNRHYLNEFISKSGCADGDRIEGKARRGGKAPVSYQHLRMGTRHLPLFSCGVSPSSLTAALLPLRVREHQDRLIAFLADHPL